MEGALFCHAASLSLSHGFNSSPGLTAPVQPIAKGHLRKCGVKIVYIAEAIPDDDEEMQIMMEALFEGKMALASHYTDDRRELAFADMSRFIDNQQEILGMMNSPHPQGKAPARVLEMLMDDEEENPDFFP